MKRFFFLLISLFSLFLIANQERFFIEVKIKDSDSLKKLSEMNLDIAGINRNLSLVGIIATEAEIELIKSKGFEVFIRESYSKAEESSIDAYYTPQEVQQKIEELVSKYPNLIRIEKISDPLWEGQKIYLVKITKDVNQPNNRISFILDAQHHARELMTSQIAVDMIEYLVENYGKDEEVTRWVDNINIFVIPMVNPDGVNYVFTKDRWWRKNRHPNCAVDLNRNYDFNWAACHGSDSVCYSETYHGEYPASEPETQFMQRFFDQNIALFAITYHSYGEYILYPLGCNDPSDNQAYYEIASELNSILENDNGQTGQYDTGPSWSTIYITDGTSDDYHYGKWGTFSFCIEVNSSGFQPDYTQWRDITVSRQRTAWKYFLRKTLNSPRVEGFVRDAITDQPIQATVEVAEIPILYENIRKAFPNGYYFRHLPKNGTYTLTFSYPGYCSETKNVTIGEDKVLLDVYLTPSGETPVTNPVPSNGAKNQKTSLTLSWNGNAPLFNLYFGETQNPPFLTSTPSNSYTLTNLEYGKTYYWRVDTVGNCGNSTGELWQFSTYPYAITSVKALTNPFRLSISGLNFNSDCIVKINGAPVPSQRIKNPNKIVAGGGKDLKNMVPKGIPVVVTVEDNKGGTSEPFTFIR